MYPITEVRPVTYDEAVAFMEQHREIAAAHSAKCPLCNGDSKVSAAFKQATRQEPVKFLCYDAFCVPCQVGFRPENLQSRLAA